MRLIKENVQSYIEVGGPGFKGQHCGYSVVFSIFLMYKDIDV